MSEPRRLLIIDDNVTNLKVAIDHLQSYGFEVLVARSGEMGLERARYAHPALILLDVQMPGIDGFETCRRLKAHPDTAAIPVLFMTVLSDPIDKVKGLEMGAVDFLTKPIDLAETIARVQTHLALRDLQLHLEERVRERTSALEAEMERRTRHEQERERLVAVISQQSEQLRLLAGQLLAAQQQTRQGVTTELDQAIQQKLHLVQAELATLQTVPHTDERTALAAPLERAQALLDEMQQTTRRLATTLNEPSLPETALHTSPLLHLTTREREVLTLLAEGRSAADIAELFVLSPATVHTYTRRIREKLGIQELAALIRFALEHHLVR
ncbi:MAG: response regulator [Ardenticatenales bacterium]|nr:response regulator [Ardenticatenales bacterium]